MLIITSASDSTEASAFLGKERRPRPNCEAQASVREVSRDYALSAAAANSFVCSAAEPSVAGGERNLNFKGDLGPETSQFPAAALS